MPSDDAAVDLALAPIQPAAGQLVAALKRLECFCLAREAAARLAEIIPNYRRTRSLAAGAQRD
jgi:hypothetical protein